MRLSIVFATLLLLGTGLLPCVASAHPGSGIVIDKDGNVYFVDTGSGVWKIDRSGKLTKLQGPAYHWMAIDENNRLEKSRLPSFASGGATVTRVGTNPTLLLSSDFALATSASGTLYYPWRESRGPLQIFALSPSDSTSVFKSLPSSTNGITLRWVNEMAIGPDGSLYYSEDKAVRKVSPRGEISTVIENPAITPCDRIPGLEPADAPYIRGLAVDSAGNVYAAVAGCRALIKIAPDKSVTTVLRAEAPWSPTSVAIYGREVYVLEYLHTAGDNRIEWIPRVKKILPDGKVETIATITRQ